MTGLQFSYEIRKGRRGEYTKELWIDRRGESKSLAMSTVLKAYENSIGAGIVDRPKALAISGDEKFNFLLSENSVGYAGSPFLLFFSLQIVGNRSPYRTIN